MDYYRIEFLCCQVCHCDKDSEREKQIWGDKKQRNRKTEKQKKRKTEKQRTREPKKEKNRETEKQREEYRENTDYDRRECRYG